jgi:hypothetical protein
MTADRYAALRAALAAGPTPGRAIDESATHVTVRNADGDAVFHDDKRIHNVLADARLIAACDPETIAALLAERDALRAIVEMADAVIEGAVTEFVRVPYGASHEDVAQINDWHRMAAETRSAMAALAAQERT